MLFLHLDLAHIQFSLGCLNGYVEFKKVVFNHSLILQTFGVCAMASIGHGTHDKTIKHSVPSGSLGLKGAGQKTKLAITTSTIGFFWGGAEEIPQG